MSGMDLSPQLQRLIEAHVESGHYHTAEDVVAAAIASLEQQDAIARLSTEELEAMYPGMAEKIARGLDDADNGRVTDGEEFFAELEREEEQSRHDRKSA